MSPALQAAEAEWLAQLASMREAIQDLKLHQKDGDLASFDNDSTLTDNDLFGNGGADIWDISDVEDDEYSSDSLDAADGVLPDGLASSVHGKDWLSAKCVEFAARKSGLNATELEQQITSLLASDSQGMELCLLHLLIGK